MKTGTIYNQYSFTWFRGMDKGLQTPEVNLPGTYPNRDAWGRLRGGCIFLDEEGSPVLIAYPIPMV